MTRRDYVALASALEDALIDADTKQERLGVALAARSIADKLADDNARFDRPRFLKAVGLTA